jgi:hypothetical protein
MKMAISIRMKENLSKTVISIVGLGVFLILAVASVDTDTGESTPSSTRERAPSKPARPDLDASVVFTGTQFVIGNNNNFDWTNVKIEINSGLIRGGYILRTNRIEANSVYTVGAAQFAKTDGERFNPFSHKVMNVTITCDDGGFYYAEWK